MWKRERTTTSLFVSFSIVTFDTTWLVSHSGRCDHASGCSTRFMRTVIRFLSSAKIAGCPSQVLYSGAGGIQYTPPGANRSIQSCHFLPSRNSDWRKRNCSTECWTSSATHVLRPGFHLVSHRRLRGALFRRARYLARLLDVVAEVPGEADPVAAVGREA